MIGVWVALAVALPLSFPSLTEMAQKHPLSMLPGDAPSSVAARQMTEAFSEPGGDDLLLVVLTDEKGLTPLTKPPTANWSRHCATISTTS